jgi:signal transduction histidine kinase
VLFRTVAENVANLLAARSAQVVRHELDGSVSLLGCAPEGSGAVDGAVASLSAPIMVDDRVWGAIEATAAEAAPPPSDAEERLTRFTELVATAIADAASRAQLAASRARVVKAGDEARRRMERDLHDGAQMRLVHTILALQLARQALADTGGEGLELVEESLEHVQRAHAELRELARGMHPSILTQGGLGLALETLARRSAIPVTLEAEIGARLPEPVEVTAYFVVSEALTNAAKHSHASSVKVVADAADDQVRISISDDGVGGADETRGSGLVGITDRVEAVGGTLTIQSRPGEGTRLTIELPVNAPGPAIPS